MEHVTHRTNARICVLCFTDVSAVLYLVFTIEGRTGVVTIHKKITRAPVKAFRSLSLFWSEKIDVAYWFLSKYLDFLPIDQSVYTSARWTYRERKVNFEKPGDHTDQSRGRALKAPRGAAYYR